MSQADSRFLVTGCAGFIGSHLTERLLELGHSVVGYDNFSTGQRRFLERALTSPRLQLVEGDVLDRSSLCAAMRGCSGVLHLAANPAVPQAACHPGRDLTQNTLATHHVLEAMRSCGVRSIGFTSTAAVYGEAGVIPTPEDAPFPVQTSLHAAAKLACEGMISAYCEAFGFQAWIFRTVPVLGERCSHGQIFDLYRQLIAHPGELHVRVDRWERQSYLHVRDLVAGMVLALERATSRVNILNLGLDGGCELSEAISWICAALELDPAVHYGGTDHPAVPERPSLVLDTGRARGLGWQPRLGFQEALLRTVGYLQDNGWLLRARGGQAAPARPARVTRPPAGYPAAGPAAHP